MTTLFDKDIAHQHVASRYENVAEDAIAIIFSIEAKFGADISNFNPWKWTVIL
jgi:hypothetical protein